MEAFEDFDGLPPMLPVDTVSYTGTSSIGGAVGARGGGGGGGSPG